MPLTRHEWARHTSEGVLLSVHVQPRAARTECVGLHGDAVKIRVAAPPVEGAANEAVVRFVAEVMGLPLRDVVMQSGETGRQKHILLRGVSLPYVKERFGL